MIHKSFAVVRPYGRRRVPRSKPVQPVQFDVIALLIMSTVTLGLSLLAVMWR